jgi:hypothetical protein
MAYNIGDKVIRLFEGDVCRVIATKDHSHKLKGENGELTGEVLAVPTGYDYVVVSENQLMSEKSFSPYYNITEIELSAFGD